MEMTSSWKARKTNSRFSALPTALGNRFAIPTFPPLDHDYTYISEAKTTLAKRINHLGWAKLNCRSGPKKLAKRKTAILRG